MARRVVSACLIVRDEEANLPRCLNSIRGSVDETIVVDTGSSDRTLDIAREAGARVFHFPWCDDFSAARNESLKHARGDWIIWIDADDELQEQFPGVLREMCRRLPSEAHGAWVEVRSAAGEQTDAPVTALQWRIFRNRAGIRFRGRVHEQPTFPGGQPNVAMQSYVKVHHWGYLPNPELLKKKGERNTRLLLLSLAEQRTNAFHYYNLGRQHLFNGRPDLALMVLEQGIEHWFNAPTEGWATVGTMFLSAAGAATESGQYAKAVEIEARTPPEYVTADLLYHAGVAHWALGHTHEAVSRLERAANDPSTINPVLHDLNTSTWLPNLWLSKIYLQLGEIEKSYRSAARAREAKPDHPDILLHLAISAGQLPGHAEEAVRWVRELLALKPDIPQAPQLRRLLLAKAYELQQPELALEALEGPVDGVTEEDAARLRTAGADLMKQRA